MIYPNSPIECLAAFAIAFMAGVLTSMTMTAWAEKVRHGHPRFPYSP